MLVFKSILGYTNCSITSTQMLFDTELECLWSAILQANTLNVTTTETLSVIKLSDCLSCSNGIEHMVC